MFISKTLLRAVSAGLFIVSGVTMASQFTEIKVDDLHLEQTGSLIVFKDKQSRQPINGAYKVWLKNGYIQSNFEFGLFEGDYKKVENNRVRFLIQYCKSRPCGSYQSFYPNGSIEKHKTYNEQGQLHGLYKEYSQENGRILRKSQYQNGKKHGAEVLYFKDGLESVYAQSHYENGLKKGQETIYYQAGGVDVKQHYLNGILNGLHIKYSTEGDKTLEANYKDGKFHGEIKMFLDGKLWMLKQYQKGLLHGKWIEYDLEQNGVTKQIKYFANDKEIEE